MPEIVTLKTIRTADEPDRSKKYETAGGQRNFHYDESRSGWTWGTKYSAFPWDRIVDEHSFLFPLTEIKKRITVEAGQLKVTDVDGDTARFHLRPHSTSHVTVAHAGDSYTAYLTKEDLVKLRDLLVEKVKEEDEEPVVSPW